MDVDTMRTIDRRVGVVLTFCLTQWLRLWRRLRPRSARPRIPRRILFIELSEMGSTILADPAMRKAKTRLGAELYFLIFAQNRDSLALLGTVADANVRTLRSDSLAHLLIDTLAALRWCRRTGIDTVIDLELFSRFTALLTGLSGASRRVGFHRFHTEGLYRGDLLTHKVAYNPHIHIAKNFVALVDALLADAPQVPYSKRRVEDEEIRLHRPEIPEEAKQRLRRRIRDLYPGFRPERQRLVLLNPNASSLLPQRCWPEDRYVALAKKILEAHDDVLVLFTGAPAERQAVARLCQAVDSARCLNLAGSLRLRELPALYAISALMVTNDSGPGHFAAVTDLPTFVLFGPETPALYGPLGNTRTIFAGLACSPCVSAANHRKSPCTDNRCLQAIGLEEVYAAIAPVLAEGRAGAA